MKEEIKDYDKMAQSIVMALGGEENIMQVTICATRLRFVLVSDGKVDLTMLEQVEGVLGTRNFAGTFQVLVGTTVFEVYSSLKGRLSVS